MENHTLVLRKHLNHFGYLFGGDLLKWVDEFAWIAASLDYPGCNFVTMGMDRVEFRSGVREGTILKFIVEPQKKGMTSVQYGVKVLRGNAPDPDDEVIFSTTVAFVRIDEQGIKTPLPR